MHPIISGVPARSGLELASAPPPATGQATRVSFRILVVLVLVCAACTCISGVVVIGNFFRIESPRVEQVLDHFLGALSNKDLPAAYSLLSSRSQRRYPASRLQELASGPNYSLFQGYLRIELTGLTFTYVGTMGEDEPQGLVATASGIVGYSDGFWGTFSAELEREQDSWRIWDLQVNVPPAKIKQERQPPGTSLFIDTLDCRCYTARTCSSFDATWRLSLPVVSPGDGAGHRNSPAIPTAGLQWPSRSAFLYFRTYQGQDARSPHNPARSFIDLAVFVYSYPPSFISNRIAS